MFRSCYTRVGKLPVTEEEAVQQLDTACQALTGYRNRPLLVLYYPVPGHMHQSDARDVYSELRSAGLTKENKVPAIDLLLHTEEGVHRSVGGERRSDICYATCSLPENCFSSRTAFNIQRSR